MPITELSGEEASKEEESESGDEEAGSADDASNDDAVENASQDYIPSGPATRTRRAAAPPQRQSRSRQKSSEQKPNDRSLRRRRLSSPAKANLVVKSPQGKPPNKKPRQGSKRNSTEGEDDENVTKSPFWPQTTNGKATIESPRHPEQGPSTSNFIPSTTPNQDEETAPATEVVSDGAASRDGRDGHDDEENDEYLRKAKQIAAEGVDYMRTLLYFL